MVDTPRFSAGSYFELAGHYRADLNEKYLLIEARHLAQSEAESFAGKALQHTYSCQVVAQPRRIPFRPPRVTLKPVISGVQTALVAGAGSQEIETDEHGRIKLKFDSA